MVEKQLSEISLCKAERVTGTIFFFCREYLEVGEVGGCGRGVCDKYIANNGRGGRCKHYGYVYDKTDEVIVVKLNED